ncbi:unannotated protein [freshwater metagenome]|uniref:Unannotated protein n=1 Tax=freshwater metagenome TaxID=449393 RepID=A0A6J7G9G1_9ZZZZ
MGAALSPGRGRRWAGLRGAVVATAVLVAAAPAAGASADPVAASPVAASPTWSPDVAAARAYAARRPGTVSFAVREGPRTWSWRGARTVPAASLMKTMFLAAHLRSGDVRGRALRAGDRALLDPMVRRSDDVTATRVRGIVGDARLRRLGRAAGMRDLRLARVWGLSRTSARDQVALFHRLDALLPARHRAYAQRLLETIVPSQRWGVGAVDLPDGWTLRFKGGWGSGSGAVDHQSALLVGDDGRRVALSITTTGNGTHARGKETLRGVALRLLRGMGAATAR